ncbi:hypothetical protein GNP88_21100 [Aliivibrio fischeri]|nr:hypothetical protein [Aliivibrio fischeri]
MTLYWFCFIFFSLLMISVGQIIQLQVNSAHLLKVHQVNGVKNELVTVIMIDKYTAHCIYPNHENITFDPSHEKALCSARVSAHDFHQSIKETQQHLVPAWPLSIVINNSIRHI